MNRTRICVVIGLLAVWGASCDRQQTETPPAPVEPIADVPVAIEPTVTESAAPQLTPEDVNTTRLAPEGEVYVIKDFTVTTEYGVHGFRKGKKVQVVREEGLDLVVTDGEVEGRADRDFFTRDLDVAEQVAAEQSALQVTARVAADHARANEAVKDAALHEQRAANVRNRRIEGLREQIQAASAQIQSLQSQIEALRPTYGTYHPGVGWSMRSSWNSSPNRQRFEQQIESLRRSIAGLESELRLAESSQ